MKKNLQGYFFYFFFLRFYPVLKATRCRGRSDSETLSDDAVIESNDEGFATDPLHHQADPLTLTATASGSTADALSAATGAPSPLLRSPLHQLHHDSIELDDAFELESSPAKLLSPRLAVPVTSVGSCGGDLNGPALDALTCLAVPQSVVNEMLIEPPELLYPQKEILPALQVKSVKTFCITLRVVETLEVFALKVCESCRISRFRLF